jgi:DNA primase
MISGHFSEELLEQIRRESDIAGLISQHVTLKKSGQNYVGLCPFHTEKTPSFTVSPAKQVFHCFGCHEGGDAFKYVMKMEGLSFPQAVRSLAEKLGIKLTSEKSGGTEPEQEEKQQLLRLHQEALDFYHSILLKHSEAQPARDYLKHRGVRLETIKAFRLGFALPSWNALETALCKKGWTVSLLEKAGLIISREENQSGKKRYYDRFRNRLLFPILDLQDRVCGFGGRTLDDNAGPKYLNSPETLIFNKRRLLYGLEKARESIHKTGFLVVVEGYFDVITAHQAGIKAVVGTLGTALTETHLHLIKRFTPKVKLVFDPDTAGVKATLRLVELIAPSSLSAEVIQLPQGQDPDSFIRSGGKDAFTSTLMTNVALMDFALEQYLSDPEAGLIDGKRRIIQSFLPAIQKIPSPIERSHYLKRLAEGLQVNEQDLLEELKALKIYNRNPAEAAAAKRSSGLPKEEEILIHLMLHHRLSSSQLLTAVQLDDFSDSRSIQMFRVLLESGDKSGNIKLHDVLQFKTVDAELTSLLTALSIKDPEKEYEDIHQTVTDCLRRVKLKKLKTNMKNLESQIRQAEKEGHADLVRNLQGQLLGLQKRSTEVAGNLSYGMMRN